MALKKKNKLQQIAAAVKRDLARAKLRRNKPKPKGNRSIARPTTTTGSVPRTSLKQRALNIKGKAKAVVRKAKGKAQAVVAKVDTKAERQAIVKKVKGKVTKAYRKVDTKMERKALLSKAKSAVSKKAKSVGKKVKAQANFRLNKLGLGGTKSRAKFKKDVKAAAKDFKGSVKSRVKSIRGKADDIKKAVGSNVRKGLSEAVQGKQTPKSGAPNKPTTRLGKLVQKGRGLKRKAGSMSAAHRKAISDGLKKYFGSRNKK